MDPVSALRRWLPGLLLVLVAGLLLLRWDRGAREVAPRPADRFQAWPAPEPPGPLPEAPPGDLREALRPAPGERVLTLRVLVLASGSGAPIPGATVRARPPGGGSWTVLGVTDAAGLVQATLAPGACEEVLASAPGWQRGRVSLADGSPGDDDGTEPRTVRVELLPGGRITGRVRFLDGSPAGAGLRVLAWPSGRPPGDRDLEEAVRGEPSVPWAETGPGGAFTVEGLDPGVRYQLAAGGPGGIFSPKSSRSLKPDTEPAVVQVGQVFGARLVVREKGGRPLRLAPRLSYRNPSFLLGSTDRTVDFLGSSRSRRLARLTGLPGDLLRGEPGWNRTILAVAEGPRSQSGPMEVSVKLPGYWPVPPFRFWLLPVEGELPVHVVELEPTARGWGILEVSFLLPRVPVWPRLGHPHEGAEILLEDQDGTKLSFGLDGVPGDGRLRLDGVPWGRYQARFQVSGSLGFRWPPRHTPGVPVACGSTPAVLELDLREMGGLLLDVLGPDGRPWTGGIGLGLTPLKVKDFGNAICPDPPYAFRGLPPGGYRMEVWPWDAALAGRPAPVEVFVPAGDWGRVAVTLPPATED